MSKSQSIKVIARKRDWRLLLVPGGLWCTVAQDGTRTASTDSAGARYHVVPRSRKGCQFLLAHVREENPTQRVMPKVGDYLHNDYFLFFHVGSRWCEAFRLVKGAGKKQAHAWLQAIESATVTWQSGGR